MAKFPTQAEVTVQVAASREKTYAFLWDVVGSSKCIPGLAGCTPAGDDTYKFVFEERSAGPVSLTVQYTAGYSGNGKDEIRFVSTETEGDNTDIDGLIKLRESATGTEIVLTQTVAPDTPVPRLVQGLIKSFVEAETKKSLEDYLGNVKTELDR